MRSFINSGAQPIFLDSSSPSFFNHYSEMNSMDNNNEHDKSIEQSKNGIFVTSQQQYDNTNASGRVESNPSVTLPNETEKQDVGNMDQKKMKRVLANRRSARESYQRRKKMFSDLEGAVTTLTKENSGLVEENKKLRCQVINLNQQLGLQLLPGGSNSVGSTIEAGILGSNSLALQQQLAAQQHHLSQPSGQHQASQQYQLAQQQGELDQLLELILKGRSS